MSESDSQSLDMSSNKNLVSKCVSKNSHSFDDRICDDLSEVLLQFLSLEDKQILECVSKQFQKTVFQKQLTITLYSSELNDKKCEKLNETNYLKSIESILKKCPNIQTMSLFLENNTIFKSILHLIIKYCRYLNEFDVSLKDRREPELNEEFLRLFSQKLKYISCGENLDFNLFPNLYSIAKKSDWFQSFPPQRLLALNLKNLKELNIELFEQNQKFLSRSFTEVPQNKTFES